MKKIDDRPQNINTPVWWDAYYTSEIVTGFPRLNDPRRAWILDNIREYLSCFVGTPRILDIGCGWGELFAHLRNANWSFDGVGVDISPVALAHGRLVTPQYEFIQCSAETLPFPDESFDIIFCGETIEHLDNPLAALLSIKLACKKGGLIIITVPYQLVNNAHEHMYEFDTGDIGRILKLTPIKDERVNGGREMVMAFVRKEH